MPDTPRLLVHPLAQLRADVVPRVLGAAMKAKEYVASYRAAATDEQTALAALFLNLNKEALALAMQRSGVPRPPDRVLIPILREFDFKWRAIARELVFNPNGWRDYWKAKSITW